MLGDFRAATGEDEAMGYATQRAGACIAYARLSDSGLRDKKEVYNIVLHSNVI